MRRHAAVLLVALLCKVSAAEVPIYEREVPTDPEELKKYMAEMEKAVKQADEAVKLETARARQAAQAQTKALDIAIADRDDEEIALANQRVLTEPAIAADAADLVKRLRKGLDDDALADTQHWMDKYGSNPSALASGAAFAWVQQAPGPALLLAAEAAVRAPKDTNVLNTLGSLLSDAGYGSRGIPILNYLANKFPNDPTLQNNLGQAWLGLGETRKAEFHLMACLRLAPGHGAANASMGVIKEAAGDHAAAAKHFRTAASTSGSAVARRAMRNLNQSYPTPRSFRRLAPVQEFFNPRHFVIPEAAATLDQVETKAAEVTAFQAFLSQHIEQAGKLRAEAGQNLAAKITTQPDLAYLATLDPGGAAGLARVPDPDGRLRRALKLAEDLEKAQADMDALWKHGEEQVAELRNAFRQEWKGREREIGEGGSAVAEFKAASEKLCAEERKIMDHQWQPIARRYDELVSVVFNRERIGTNETLTYLPLMSNGDLYRQEFYSIVIDHLGRMGQLAGANPIRHYTCGANPLAGAFSPAEGDIPGLGSCPLKVSAKFAGVKLKADCKSIAIDFEAGLKFSAKKDFQSGETTLKGGVGVDLDLHGVGAVEGSGAFVVMWDRGNDLSFIGVESSANATLAGIPGLEGEFTEEDVTYGGSLPNSGTPDIVNVSSETTLGVTLGPRGVEPTLRGNAGIEVLGRDLVRAEL